MGKELTPEERRRAYQREYYERNKERLQAAKKARYEEDKKYRESTKKSSQRRYWLKRRQRSKKPLPEVNVAELEPVLTVDIEIEDKEDTRFGQTVQVNLYTIQGLSALVARKPQAVRNWFYRGAFPEPHWRSPDFPGKVRGKDTRLFTEDVLKVVEEDRVLMQLPSKGLEDSLFFESVRTKFGEMHKGLKRQSAS